MKEIPKPHFWQQEFKKFGCDVGTSPANRKSG